MVVANKVKLALLFVLIWVNFCPPSFFRQIFVPTKFFEAVFCPPHKKSGHPCRIGTEQKKKETYLYRTLCTALVGPYSHIGSYRDKLKLYLHTCLAQRVINDVNTEMVSPYQISSEIKLLLRSV